LKVLIIAHSNTGNVLSLAKELSGKAELTVCYIMPGNMFQSGIINIDIRELSYGLNTNSSLNLSLLNNNLENFIGNSFNFWILKTNDLKFLRDKGFRNYKLIKKSASVIKQNGFNIIHFNGESGFLFYLRLYLKKYIIFWTIHDFISHSGEHSLKAIIYKKFLIKYPFYFIQHYKYLKDLFCSKTGIKRDKVFQIYSGKLNVYHNFSGNEERFINGDYILFFGRISKYKGIEYLLKAFNNLSTEFPNTRLIIAGKGNLDFNIKEYSNHNVKFINDYIDNTLLVNLISNCKIVVMPYTDATHSATVVTAYAFNKPVLCSDVGGLGEVVKNDVTGLLFRLRDAADMEEKIRYALTNPHKLETWSRNIENIEEEFNEISWQFITDKYIKAYEYAINCKNNST